MDIIIGKIMDNRIWMNYEIIPSLYTNFASKSFQCAGLGHFIPKVIVTGYVEEDNGIY
jgi:hypothetical protein